MKAKAPWLGMLATCAIALSGCSPSTTITVDPSAPTYGTIRISTGISEETALIATIYSQALQEAGYTTELVDTGKDRAGYLKAMEAAQAPSPSQPANEDSPYNDPTTVDITPDYSGNLLLYLTNDGKFSPAYIQQERRKIAEENPNAMYTYGWGENDQAAGEESVPTTQGYDPNLDQLTPHNNEASAQKTPTPTSTPTGFNVQGLSDNEIINAIKQVLPDGLSTLKPASAQNRDTLAVTKATAAKYQLSSLSDIGQYCKDLTLGAPESFKHRSYGLQALERYYHCVPKNFQPVNSQAKLSEELAADHIQIADIFSASATIEDNAYTILEDPAGIFISQQIVPIVRAEELPQSAREAIDSVSSRLSSTDLTEFNRLTSGQGAISNEDVAKFWLKTSRE
ncbi:glycine betaine ABC transporter substrate-binding protein [Rothia sp. P6271]|uniref:glycine betaine ABC transporter substrate-binding protein n=1 Tax=unclassified Rothia (in: high G+C Gram-positive bacteria) TaxID=2689056 RepID=UPI003AC378B5